MHDGSIPDQDAHPAARAHVATIATALRELAPSIPHDEAYLSAAFHGAVSTLAAEDPAYAWTWAGRGPDADGGDGGPAVFSNS